MGLPQWTLGKTMGLRQYSSERDDELVHIPNEIDKELIRARRFGWLEPFASGGDLVHYLGLQLHFLAYPSPLKTLLLALTSSTEN